MTPAALEEVSGGGVWVNREFELYGDIYRPIVRSVVVGCVFKGFEQDEARCNECNLADECPMKDKEWEECEDEST